MLVQPALIAHLLCRPVSIADSRDIRGKLQVLSKTAVMCYFPRSLQANPIGTAAANPVKRRDQKL
jgi:hypothetical protein